MEVGLAHLRLTSAYSSTAPTNSQRPNSVASGSKALARWRAPRTPLSKRPTGEVVRGPVPANSRPAGPGSILLPAGYWCTVQRRCEMRASLRLVHGAPVSSARPQVILRTGCREALASPRGPGRCGWGARRDSCAVLAESHFDDSVAEARARRRRLSVFLFSLQVRSEAAGDA